MAPIKFGTDGWRAIIDEEFTEANVARVAQATALWLLERGFSSAVVGFDCRRNGKLYADTTAAVLNAHGIRVYLAESFVSTPMVSYAVRHLGAGAGIVITASHNPPEYNGFKLKSHFGGPSLPEEIARVEELVPETAEVSQQHQGIVTDLEQLYLDAVNERFDMAAIRQSGIRIAYDAMFGAGQHVVRELLPDATFLRCTYNPGFDGQAPEPILKNLHALSKTVADDPGITFGLATDGDADRLGVFDENGRFVDAHHIILLLVHYLHHYKKMSGKVVVAFSATGKVKRLAEHYGLPFEVTKIGFKHICRRMIEEDVIVGGEESGGIAVKGHIPERDGVWDALLLLEFMAATGKKLSTLIEELYAIVGPFSYDRLDVHLDDARKAAVMQQCAVGIPTFGPFRVESTENLDGYKFHLGLDRWLMIRASGTEPLVRIYAEGRTPEEVADILAAARDVLLS
jgi:phosphomannomutase